MMTIGIPTVQFKPAPEMFYVPNTRITREACIAYEVPPHIVDKALGGTWPIAALDVHNSDPSVCAPDCAPVEGWWFPLEAVQLL